MSQSDKGFFTAKPHPFPIHSHAGGVDTSASVVRRLFSALLPRSLTPFINTKSRQPNEQRVQVNAFMGHFIGAETYIGRNSFPHGANPNPFQPGMLYMPEQSFPVVGLGGLVNGEMLAQDLLDPSDPTTQQIMGEGA